MLEIISEPLLFEFELLTLSYMSGISEPQESALKTVDVNGTQLHYIERGQENNNKQSVSCFHSWRSQ